ncbi:MAG: 6-aminohexanoate hydrolase, partial [Kiloniellaceae bacterium]
MKRVSPVIMCLALLAFIPQIPAPAAAQAEPQQVLAAAVEEARALEPLETLIVAQHGEIVVEQGFRGHATTQPTNIKSVSKTIISALVGIAIEKGILDGPEAK